MASVVAVIVAVAGLLGGIVLGMFGALGALVGAFLLAASSVIFLFLPAL